MPKKKPIEGFLERLLVGFIQAFFAVFSRRK